MFHSIPDLTFRHAPKLNPIIVSSNSKSRNIIEPPRFLCHIMTIVTYFWLKFETYPEKVPVMTNNAITQAATFVNIYFETSKEETII